MRDLIKQFLIEYTNKEELKNILNMYEQLKEKITSKFPFLEVSHSFYKNNQEGKLIVNVKDSNINFEDITNKVNETIRTFTNTKEFLENTNLAWKYFRWDFHPNTYNNFSQTDYVKERKKYIDEFKIHLKDFIFNFNGVENKSLEKKIKDFQRLSSSKTYEDILSFLQNKTDIPLDVTIRNTSKTFFITITPQLTFQDFMTCKFHKWDFPFDISKLYEDVSNFLGFNRNEERGWTFDIKLYWPRDVGNYVVSQNEKLRTSLKNELKETFGLRIDYFLCAQDPIISIGSAHNPNTDKAIPIDKKFFDNLIKESAKKIGINKPKIKYLEGYYWFTQSAYKTDDKRYWTKQQMFDFFINKSTDVFGDIYSYDITKFQDLDSLTEVFCKQHQRWFEVLPKEHMGGKRCPFDNESKGETMVRVYLEKNNIPFKQFHKLKGCFSEINGRCILLTFDFYLPEQNAVIEYDGEQHYRPVERFGGEPTYQRQVLLDNIKNVFCDNTGVKMIRIPYTIKKPKDIKELLDLQLK
jgi:hypothetical protein